MHTETLLTDTENTVEQLFRDRQDPRLFYHNEQHTRDVVSAVITISGQYTLGANESFPIIAAAWWHDIGYLFSGPENHEQVSAAKASEYYTAKGVGEETIKIICGCIMATKVPQHPQNLYEQIICDADLFHFGKTGFMEKSRLLKKENELFSCKEMTGTEWRAITIGFMTGHKYFTDFALRELSPQKEEYLAELVKKQAKRLAQKEASEMKGSGETAVVIDSKDEIPKKEKKPDKDDSPTRGIETLFRLTSKNHMDMSAMADSKAGIMISVNSIIVSVVISVLLRKLEDSPYLILPTLLLLLVNISTIIFSILATRPKILGGGILHRKISTTERSTCSFLVIFIECRLKPIRRGSNKCLATKTISMRVW